MITARIIRGISISILVTLVVMLMLWARWNPEEYGLWLQQIDNARYEYIDCDCTAPITD